MTSLVPALQAPALPGRTILLQFVYWQAMDVLSTLAFLLSGVREGNPFVRWAIQTAPDPLTGLVAVKVFAILLGLTCWGTNRMKLLSRVNLFFAALVAWNLVCLIIGLTARGN
jgi:hypothetical protein